MPKFKDKRRKHNHYSATITYQDGEKFSRKYLDRDRALRFTARQKKSPVVKATRVVEIIIA